MQTVAERLTALMIAICSGHVNIASILISGGTDTSIETAGGVTALHFTSKCNRSFVAKQILSQKAETLTEIDFQDSLGRTPLMIASSCGHLEMVNLLLEAGARVNISNFSDYPSLHLPPHQISMPEEVSTVRGSALGIAVITGHVDRGSLPATTTWSQNTQHILLTEKYCIEAVTNAKLI